MHTRYCIRTGNIPLRRIRRHPLYSVRFRATQAQKTRCFLYLISGR